MSCLVKLAPVLQDPAPQYAYTAHTSHDEAIEDIDLAKRMFPKATLSLLRRVGAANRKRRLALLHLKLKSNTSIQRNPKYDVQQHHNKEQSLNTGVTKSNDWIAAFSHNYVASTPGSSCTGRASTSESIFSKPDYFSYRSASSVTGSDHVTRIERLDVPNPPTVLKTGATFECIYCGQEVIHGLQVGSNDDWTSHVFLDLEPYICTFENCLRADKTFGSRENWFQHELDNHRLHKIWSCQSCDHVFDEIEDIELHLNEKHNNSKDPSQLSMMVSMCERYSADELSNRLCPFCGCLSANANSFEEHVADHMEQLALTSIQSIYGPERPINVPSSEDTSSETETKLEFLNHFVDEQRGYFWKPQPEPLDDESVDSYAAFMEDSDDEISDRNIHFSPVEPVTADGNSRPLMKRRGESWMAKVNSFLDNQPVEQPGIGALDLNVQTSHETQSPREQTSSEIGLNSPLRSPVYPGAAMDSYEPALLRPLRCLRTRPPPRNKDFVGRESDLARLDQRLSRPGSACVVSGHGGMGKTGIAIEYTYRCEGAFSYIFWISAETAISCADTYSLIATDIVVSKDHNSYEQGRLNTLGREFLEQTKLRWLLVFDNVTSWSDIRQYIPSQLQTTSGSILITSRKSDFADCNTIPQCQALELKALTLEESRLFLLNSMQPNREKKSMSSHPEYKLAGVVAKEAEGLPLALSHIAGYIQVSECTLKEFVELWNERRRHVKTPGSTTDLVMLSTMKALETVWNIGLREVTIDARELLNILAFLDSDNVQRKLLVGEHKDASLDFLHSDQAFRFEILIQSCKQPKVV